MAALNSCFNLFILFISVCFSDRRFSEFKRCADDECSMLLCRGKASKDFFGPDCRFLSFRAGETIYVYYKLSGQRSDVWAGSVGNSFGYFPKDYLNINHIYTEKEIEVTAEETDFVCFDSGRDKFQSYDVDALIGKWLLNVVDETEEMSPGEDPATEGGAEETGGDDTNSDAPRTGSDGEQPDGDDSDVDESQDPELALLLESSEKDGGFGDTSEGTNPENLSAKDDEKISDHTTRVEGFSELKTTLGGTFDAVASDEENTQKVTPHDDGDDDDDEDQSIHLAEQLVEVEEETMKKPSLLTFEEKPQHFEDNVPDESGNKQVPLQLEDTSHGATDGETRETVPNQLPPETRASHESTDQNISQESLAKDDRDLENGSDSTTLMEGFSEVKTSLGGTYDTVASDDKNTQKVTPHEDDGQSNKLVIELEEETMKKPPMLTSEEKPPRFMEDIPDTAESEDVSFRTEKIGLGDKAAENEENRETSRNFRTSDSFHKEDESGHLQDTLTYQQPSETKTANEKISVQNSASADADPDLAKPTNKIIPGELSTKECDSTTQTEGSSKLKTSWGGTFDAVASDDEITQKVTPHDDDNDKYQNNHLVEQSADEEVKTMEQPSLLTFQEQDVVPENRLPSESVEVKTNDGVWSNFGDEVLKIVSGGERTDLPKDDDDEEEDYVQTTEKDVDDVPIKLSVNESKVLKSNEDEMRPDEIKAESLYRDETLIDIVESKNVLLKQALDNLDKPLQERPHSEPEPDEQIRRAKNEIINVFEGALKTEKPSDKPEEEEEEDVEKLLEDENALLATKTDLVDTEKSTNFEAPLEENRLVMLEQVDKINQDETMQTDTSASTNGGLSDNESIAGPTPESEYSESVRRLSLLRDRFKDDEIERFLRHLSIKDLYKVEAMFTDLDHQLKSATQLHPQNAEELEHALESILEVLENAILDEVDRMLDTQERRVQELGRQIDQPEIDEEATILDDLQEFAFYLRRKYSASVPLVKENEPRWETADNASIEPDNVMETVPSPELPKTPEVPHEADEPMGPGEDAGHFNKNEDNQAALQDTTDLQRGPRALLENPLDVLGLEIHSPSESVLESPDSSMASDFSNNNANYEPAGASAHTWDFILLASEVLGVDAEILISALPEEWRPGPTFHGLPWKPVVATSIVGLLTVLVFMWRSVLSVKSRMYLLTEKQLTERIQQLIKDKSDVLNRITEVNTEIKQYEEKLNNSEESQSSLRKEFNDLKTHYQDLKKQKQKVSVNFAQLHEKIAKTQEENKTLNEKITTMHQGIENYQKTLKVYDEERSKVLVLMDEAKLREEALKAQVLSFEKDNSALKEQKKSLLKDAKDWQEKHEKLSEEIKVYHKTQTELENALVHKENEIDVLSGCIAELKSFELCNDAEMKMDKNGDPVKWQLKQMMDVSRIKATLSVIEDERNRLFENFIAEQKARQELEEKFQKVIHDQTNLKNEKTHMENQYKNLQQRLEITTELYHQKENILHQKLTQEELERHEKESKLSEVDGRAVQAEEELNRLKQKVKDMQEEMQQNERTLKSEIAVQEKKAHENWLKARSSERALIEERRECANLRQKIVECSDKMSDFEHALYKSGPPDRHMPPLQRGDSYGPSPVSGGAPSPPLMIEDPGRPPSGPLGRRGEPYGLRRSAETLGHPLPFRPELSVPRTSSPCTQDGSHIPSIEAEVPMQTSTDPTEAIPKSQRQSSFLPSPIRESPVPALKAYGPRPVGGPLPPVMRPPNGHSPMINPGPSFGPEPPFRPPHMEPYRPPFPLRSYGPIPPPFVHGPPRRDFQYMGPHPLQDFPPNFAAPQDPHFRPWPLPSGALPPPGAMPPPAVNTHGPGLSTPPQPREAQQMPHAPPEQMVAQDAPKPAVTES